MTAGVHGFIDAQGDSRRLLVALDGRVKLVLLAAALSVNLISGGLLVPLLLALGGLLLSLAGGARAKSYLRRMAVPLLLGLVAFFTQLFWVDAGEVLLRVPLGPWSWSITSDGVLRGLELAARIAGGMSVLLSFSLTTPLPEMMRAARFFRVPPVLVELTLIMYRYIFLLLEEGSRIRTAEKARLGFVDARTGVRSATILGGMLLLRTFDRAERSFAAMRCRGYRGALTGVLPGKLQGRDWGVLVIGLLLLTVLYLVR